MGRRCRYSGRCHVYQGLVQLKQPLFLVKNIYCNNGMRWWSRCKVFEHFNASDEVNESLIPSEDLRQK